MNQRLDLLQPYPFERLRRLLDGRTPPAGLAPISLGIGEPQHPTPPLIRDALTENLHLLGKYPPTGGSPELRVAIAAWLSRRYGIPAPDPDRSILPVAGTREALFAFAQAVVEPSDPGHVLFPNPYYQIYEGAALLAGATPVYVPTPEDTGFKPDWSAVSSVHLNGAKLVYICSPGNPAGAVMTLDDWRAAFDLADRFGFVIAADECYSEIYNGDPPTGALEAAHRLGRGVERLVVFNSLSKRSSAPGLRSGFVAGDPEIISQFLLYRTYHGAAPSSLTQAASVGAWMDEAHVVENRKKYQEKFKIAKEILPEARIPEGGFFLWLKVGEDEDFTRRAYEEQGLTVLPGRYLAREVDDTNPGEGYVRAALVSEPEQCQEALTRLKRIF